ncbi:MAG: response regulator [Alphaproteobacteria bacterium]|nr:response regulator [Alphaproteobacteria bacterium]
MRETILIVDDEKDICMLIEGLLEDEGYKPLIAHTSDEAYAMIEKHAPDLIIQDIWLQGSSDDGLQILKNTKEVFPNLPFLMISGHGTIETAVSAIKIGAYDFIEKPFQTDRLLLMVHRALENAALKRQNIQLQQRAQEQDLDITEQIPEDIRKTLEKVAKTNSRLLITGEVGTGKNVSAQYIHEKSERAKNPFMVLSCSGKTSEKLEAELFGTTGENARLGLLELADGGTVLLDEVMDLPVDIQGKILTLLQENAYYKVGSNKRINSNIRIIASTSDVVEHKLRDGSFREDLYYRLNVVPLEMQSLRERKHDIPKLVSSFSKFEFTNAAMLKLQNHNWPGNMKQLRNVLEWLSIMYEPEEIIDKQQLPPEFGGGERPQTSNDDSLSMEHVLDLSLREARESFERYYLLSQVNKFDGNISKTAEFIGMERSALHRKLKSLEVFSDDKQNVA